ncbi:thiamine pyrophosphate-binding protein [Dactylosporangium sp. NPDC000555]|uniref:thiamine pyrophosphate-binding protein n=1 Tax=Dactylosporangium sp. NPDC000555 TaxID=3154260 RepID=UPI00331B3E8E
MRVVERMADILVAEGVEAVFALMGDGNMMLLDALVNRGVRVVQGRHEGAVLAMADGYARASGRPGVCAVTSGPGLTQTVTSLTVAARHRSAVVVVAGATPRGPGGRPGQPGFQYLDQGPVAAAAGAAFRLLRAGSVDEDLGSALVQARRERRPVVVGAPIDAQEGDIADPGPYRPPRSDEGPPVPPPVDRAAVAEAVRRLARSRRPVILAGAGVVEAGAADTVAALARRAGALLATTLLAKDLYRGEPFAIGLAGGFSRRTARELLGEADCVLAVGASLSAHTTDSGRLFPRGEVIQVDLDPRARGALRVRGDLRAVVPEIAAALPAGERFRTAAVAARIAGAAAYDDADLPAQRAALERSTLHPLDAMRALDRALPPDARVVLGVGHFWWFPAITLTRDDPRQLFCTYDFGTIGQAMPTAVGVALATGAPAVVVDGDGSLLMNVQELETLARERIPVTVVVLNDGAYGAEVHRLGARGGDCGLARFGRPDFAAIAAGFGVRGVRAAAPDAIGEAVRGAGDGPLVVDVPMSATAISEPYQRMFPAPRRDASAVSKG